MDNTVEILIRKVAKLENEIVRLNARISSIEAMHQSYGANYGYNENDSLDSHIALCQCDNERDW